MKIKVLLYIDSFMVGGMHKQILYLAKYLNREKIDLIICTQNSSEGGLRNQFIKTGCKLIDLNRNSTPKNKKPFNPFMSLRLLKVLKDENPNIIFLTAASNLLYFRFSNFFYPGEISQIGSFRSLSFWKGHLSKYYRPLDNFLAKWLYSSSDYLIVNSENLKIHYKDIVKEKKTKPIKVIHNAYDFQISLTKDKKLIKTELNVTDSNFIIVMIARLDPWKDFQTLLSVAEIVIKSYNSVVFYLIGDGQLKREINNEITKRELNDNVILTGEKKDIHNYINICNISVLSTHGEGSSNAIIESMACGKPIIATDVGGNSEIIGTDGKCGILIPPESPAEFSKAVTSLIRDDIKLKNMGKAAQKRIQNLCNMEKYISSYENLFSSVYVKSGE